MSNNNDVLKMLGAEIGSLNVILAQLNAENKRLREELDKYGKEHSNAEIKASKKHT